MNEGSFKRVKAIAKKEVVEFTRDWRTIIAIIVIPILMFPLLFIMFPLLLESEAAELDSIVVDIVIQSDETPISLMEEFNTTSIIISEENLSQEAPLSEPGDDLNRLRSLSVDAILRVEKREDAWYYAILHISTSESFHPVLCESFLPADIGPIPIILGWTPVTAPATTLAIGDMFIL